MKTSAYIHMCFVGEVTARDVSSQDKLTSGNIWVGFAKSEDGILMFSSGQF